MNPVLALRATSRDDGDSAPQAVGRAAGGLAVSTRGLSKRFGSRVALHDVDLAVPRGCAFGFLGPNGAGKTTMIRLLLGLAEPSAGEIRLLGHALPGGAAPRWRGSARSSRSRASTRTSAVART